MSDPKTECLAFGYLTAISGLGYRQGEGGRITVSRSKQILNCQLREHAGRNYKHFKQLQDLGYIKWPDRHIIRYKSEVKFM